MSLESVNVSLLSLSLPQFSVNWSFLHFSLMLAQLSVDWMLYSNEVSLFSSSTRNVGIEQ